MNANRETYPFHYVMHTYRGCNITPCSRNSAGMRWESYVCGRFIRADTLAGIKSMIREMLRG